MPREPIDVPISRDRARTESELISAVGKVISADGFGALGVNAVARQAGTDKVMIYRYFGGLPGLMRRYAETADFWWQPGDLLSEPFPDADRGLGAAMHELFDRHCSFIRSRPVTLEVLAWEMSERNALTEALEEVRETRSVDLLRLLAARHGLGRQDAEARLGPAFAFLGAAANYLAVRARRTPTFTGVDIGSETGWQEIGAAVRQMVDAFDTPRPHHGG